MSGELPESFFFGTGRTWLIFSSGEWLYSAILLLLRTRRRRSDHVTETSRNSSSRVLSRCSGGVRNANQSTPAGLVDLKCGGMEIIRKVERGQSVSESGAACVGGAWKCCRRSRLPQVSKRRTSAVFIEPTSKQAGEPLLA